MPLSPVESKYLTPARDRPAAYPLIKKAIGKLDGGDLPPFYTSDLRVLRQVLAEVLELPDRNDVELSSLKARFAAAIEGSNWFRNTELVRHDREASDQHLTLNDAGEAELGKNLEHLLENGLPGLFRGISNNYYHNFSHCRNMAERALAYTEEFDLSFSPAEAQALKVGLICHDGAHSGVVGPDDFDHNVQYAAKLAFLFMDYYGFSKQQIGFAIEGGILPTVSFNSEFVPQDAVGLAAELGDLAFEVEFSHFMLNSLHVLQEQIPTIIAPPDTITNWLRVSVRDEFLGSYLQERTSDVKKILVNSSNIFERLSKWLRYTNTQLTELADYEEKNKKLPGKFKFFEPIRVQAIEAINNQTKMISDACPIEPQFGTMQKTRGSLFRSLERALIPEGSSRVPRRFFL